jgi:hypothetical protein
MGHKVTEPKSTRRAVLVTVLEDGEGFRISLDDAVCQIENAETWIQKEHVTSKPLAGSAFEKMKFDEKELSDFGYYILARLSAFIKRNEN